MASSADVLSLGVGGLMDSPIDVVAAGRALAISPPVLLIGLGGFAIRLRGLVVRLVGLGIGASDVIVARLGVVVFREGSSISPFVLTDLGTVSKAVVGILIVVAQGLVDARSGLSSVEPISIS